MSRSYNQYHKLYRNKNKYLSNPFRRRKHSPYGNKGWCGYGGEIYSKNPYDKESSKEEIVTCCVNKSKARRQWKYNIIEELNEKNWDIILNKLIDKFDNTYVLIKKFY